MLHRILAAAAALGLAGAFLAGFALGREQVRPGSSSRAAEGYGLVALRNTYDPGEGAAFHEHTSPRLVVVLSGGSLEIGAEDGSVRRVDLAAGQVALRGPESHSVRNVGETTVETIEMEVPR